MTLPDVSQIVRDQGHKQEQDREVADSKLTVTYYSVIMWGSAYGVMEAKGHLTQTWQINEGPPKEGSLLSWNLWDKRILFLLFTLISPEPSTVTSMYQKLNKNKTNNWIIQNSSLLHLLWYGNNPKRRSCPKSCSLILSVFLWEENKHILDYWLINLSFIYPWSFMNIRVLVQTSKQLPWQLKSMKCQESIE